MAAKKVRDVQRLRDWTQNRRKDPAYRARVAAERKARHAALVADAEYGRKCRALFALLGELIRKPDNTLVFNPPSLGNLDVNSFIKVFTGGLR